MIAFDIPFHEDAPVRQPQTMREGAFYNAGVIAALHVVARASAATATRSPNLSGALHDIAAMGRALLIYRNDETGLSTPVELPAILEGQ